jgi:hypothetical protein
MDCAKFIVQETIGEASERSDEASAGRRFGAAALALLFLAGCGETTEERAASGGLGGAAAGAVVGGPVGAVVGGAAGATGGAVLDEGVDEKVDEAAD